MEHNPFSQKQESVESKKDQNIENLQISEQVKNIQEVFEIYPELRNIGNEKQYLEYIKTIFPDSKFIDKMFQHQTRNEFENFSNDHLSNGSLGEGHYFSNFGDNYVLGKSHKIKKIVVLNIQKPKYIEYGEFMKKVYSLVTERGLNDNDEELRYEIKKECTEELKKEFDSIISNSPNGRLNSETLVFDQSQIHILGSKDDIEKFKEFVSNMVR